MVERRMLGRSGPRLTTVGFGAWAAGGPWFFGWGRQDDRESVDAIQKSLELGVDWIDTAAVYGSGHSEEVVGRAVAGFGRELVFIATKCGRFAVEGKPPRGDLRPESIRRELEESLARLRTDHVDLYQIHWPDNETGTPVEDSWAAMARLLDEGKTRYIGVSNFDVPLLRRCEAIRHVNSLQPPYSLLARSVEPEVLPYCLENGIGVIVYSPMHSGLLTGKFDRSRLAPDDWRRRAADFQEPKLARHLAFVERLRPIAARQRKTVGQLAIAWTLEHPAITSAIVGARNASQAEENAAAMGYRLSDGEKREIEKAYREVVITA
jgi:aryl-alcohol dehydrogenase-like predicted oxidoreductase